MRFLTILIMLAMAPVATGQNTVSGRVVDELGLPIYRASIEIDQTDQIVYSDYDGLFKITSPKAFHWKINITSKGFKPETYFVLDGGNAGDIVLEYGEALKKLMDGQSSLYRKKNLHQGYALVDQQED